MCFDSEAAEERTVSRRRSVKNVFVVRNRFEGELHDVAPFTSKSDAKQYITDETEYESVETGELEIVKYSLPDED